MFLAASGQFPDWQKLRSARFELLAIATLFLSINYLLFLEGLVRTSPTNSEVLIQLAPAFMSLGALVVFKERYTRSQWIGVAVLTLGMSLFFNDQLQVLAAASTTYLMGSGILALAAAAWAVYALAQKQLLQQLSSSTIMLVIYGGSALLFTPFASPQQVLTLSSIEWTMLIFCGLNTLLAYGAFAEALDHWEASRVSAVVSLAPIFTLAAVMMTAMLFPRLIAPEHINVLGLVGAVLVMAGSFTIALGQREKQSNA